MISHSESEDQDSLIHTTHGPSSFFTNLDNPLGGFDPTATTSTSSKQQLSSSLLSASSQSLTMLNQMSMHLGNSNGSSGNDLASGHQTSSGAFSPSSHHLFTSGGFL